MNTDGTIKTYGDMRIPVFEQVLYFLIMSNFYVMIGCFKLAV